MTLRLQNQRVVLTGAAGNIGSTISRHLLREGARVVMTGRNIDKLDTFVETLVAEGFERERILAVQADSADSEACRAAVQAAVEAWGGLDVLVNNAGGAGPKRALQQVPFTDAEARAQGGSETMFDAAMNLLGGPWNMARAAVPVLRPGGSIVNVSTIFSRTVYFGRIPYVVPKAGLNALTQGLAQEVGRSGKGIRVNTVYPGPIESERIDGVFAAMDELQSQPPGTTSKTFREYMILERPDAEQQLGLRYPTTADVASTITWLATEESGALSGQAFEVTNGMTVPTESRSELVSWPDKRLVDLRGQVVLVLGGRDMEEALAFTDRHTDHGADVVLAFRTLDQLERARTKLQTRDQRPIRLQHLDPQRPDTVERVLGFVADQYGRLDGVVVLPPAPNRGYDFTITSASDDEVESFVRDEVVAPVALASALARLLTKWDGLQQAPAITFVTNPDDGRGNRLNHVNRAAVEALIRVWRDEEAKAVEAGDRKWGCAPNQIVRFASDDENSLAFSAAWAATLTNRVRRMDSINLWVPPKIQRATGKSAMPLGVQRVLPGLHAGRTAIVTGGSVGIGFQLGRFLAMAGARVLLSARNAGRLQKARASIVEELRLSGYPDPDNRVFIQPDVDVGSEASLERLVAKTVELFGGVDYLINNAGIAGAEEMVVDMSVAAWSRTMEANLISNYSLIRKFAPLMKNRGRGKVLNVSSYFGGEKYLAVAYPNRADYSVSKAGQRSLAEILSRHLGPEIQINALAPGPVDGQRLRGTPDAPGLFARRGRLILENKRLNQVHAAALEAVRGGHMVGDFLDRLASNRIGALLEWTDAPGPLRKLVERVASGKPNAVSSEYLMSGTIAPKLAARLEGGGHITGAAAEQFQRKFVDAPEPFFDDAAVQEAAEKIESGIINRLHLHTMPTDEQVSLSTVFAMADDIVSGETFHPSGGLKFERSVTEGELMVPPGREDLDKLAGKNVVIIGEALEEEIIEVVEGFIGVGVAKVGLLTRTEAAATRLPHHFAAKAGLELWTQAVGDDLEGGLSAALERMGQVHVVVSFPFARLPQNALAAEAGRSWDRVLSRDEFAGVIDGQLTHHFRVARRAALWERCQIVLVTPDTSRASTREEFALALFCKNSLHAFTSTIGVEGERLPTAPAVNQVQLTRRSRSEEPSTDSEVAEEMRRFVAAVLQCSLPAPSPRESRYLARIFRGNAVTV